MSCNITAIKDYIWDVNITEQINVENALHFKADFTKEIIKNQIIINNEINFDEWGNNDYVWKYIITGINAVSDGTNICEVTAQHEFYYKARKKFFVNFGEQIGVSAENILGKIFNAEETSNEFVLDNCTIYKNIDFSLQSKKTMLELIESVIDSVGYGEINLLKNQHDIKSHVEILESIGKEKNVIISINENAQSIQTERQSNGIITRLYAWGKDGIDMTSVINKGYIDSDNIAEYGLLVGFKEFPECATPEDLHRRAVWEFDYNNPERIDIPQLTVTVKYVDLSCIDSAVPELELGDSVYIYDNQQNINIQKRVISRTFYPYEREKTTLTFGNMQGIYTMLKNRRKSYKIITEKTDNIKQTIKNEVTNQIENLPEIPVETVTASVIKSDVVMGTFCISRYTVTEWLETNFSGLDATKPYNKKRKFCRIFGDNLQCIEADLLNETECYKDKNGSKLYWTAVSGENAYKFMTYESPLTIAKDKRPEGYTDDEFKALYEVKVWKTEKEYIKTSWGFPTDSGTGEPEFIIGTGSGEGDNGKLKIKKDTESGEFVYYSRFDGLARGIKIVDDGCYYSNDGQKWIKLGESIGGNVKIIDHTPTEVDLTGENTVFVRYDNTSEPVLDCDIGTLFNSSDVYVEVPKIAKIAISPASAEVYKGESIQFSCNVDVIWSINSQFSTISETGLLTINSDETADNIIVKAVSTVDNNKFAVATVDVNEKYVKSPIYLWDNGITEDGGSPLVVLAYTTNQNYSKWSVGDSMITLSQPSYQSWSGSSAIFPNTKINFSNYSKAYIHFVSSKHSTWTGHSEVAVGICPDISEVKEGSSGTQWIQSLWPTPEEGNDITMVVDISSLTSEGYFNLISDTGEYTIDKIWIEK